MSASPSDKLQPTNLLEGFVINWQKLRPNLQNLPTRLDQEDIFICPLCHEVFPRNKWSGLTLEHVPPESVGGKGIAITCAPCNHNSGSKLDSHLVHEQGFLDFMEGIPYASVDVRYSVNELAYPLTGRLSFGPSGEWLLVGDPKRTNPTYLEDTIASLKKRERNGRINFRFKGHNQRRARLSLLRAAYLWGFASLGYIFLFNNHLENVRQQITNPLEENEHEVGILKADFSSEYVGVNIIREPRELRSYLIVFELRSQLGTLRRRGIVLPAPIEDGIGIYERLKEFSGSLTSLQVTHFGPDYDFNQDPFSLLKLWAELD